MSHVSSKSSIDPPPSIEDRVEDMYAGAALLSRTLDAFAAEASIEDEGKFRGVRQDAFRALSAVAGEIYWNLDAVACALQSDTPKKDLAGPFVWPAPDVEGGRQ